MQGFSGYLLASTAGVTFERKAIAPDEMAASGGASLRFISHAYRLRQWDELELTSPIPLADEVDAEGAGPYKYKVLAVRGFSKVVLLAERRRIVDYVLGQLLDRYVAPRLRKVALNLDETVSFCQLPDSAYLVTSLLGRFAGSARQLRAIALYGDDVTDTALFRDYGKLFNIYSCGLGRRFENGVPTLTSSYDGEIVRIGNDGFVLAHLGNKAKAKEFMKVVRFVIDHRWVEPWVPIADQEGDGLG